MSIRTFQPGDEAAQVSIYNEAAADLPKFKPATLDEVRRRGRAADFDPSTRFLAVADGLPVGYATFQATGRVSYAWCRKGHERHAEPLFEAVLEEMQRRGLRSAFAAYRGDWPAQRDFFLAHGFRAVREVVNFVMDLADMPTPAARASNTVEPLRPDDIPAVFALGAGVVRAASPAELEAHLLRNPYFPPGATYLLRGRTSGEPLAAAVVVTNPAYADPTQVDAAMPCFRLGAFGTEGLTTKRLNGLFSFVARPGADLNALGLALLSHAAARLYEADLGMLAAQAPSDAPLLARFYQQLFRRQGSFPVFERAL
jgi:hypothetical protein